MPKSFTDILQWLVSGGAAILAAVLFSWIAEEWPAFQNLKPHLKRLAMVVVCAFLSLAAWAVLKYATPETLAALDEPAKVIILAISALLSNQGWHTLVNKPSGQRLQSISLGLSQSQRTNIWEVDTALLNDKPGQITRE